MNFLRQRYFFPKQGTLFSELHSILCEPWKSIHFLFPYCPKVAQILDFFHSQNSFCSCRQIRFRHFHSKSWWNPLLWKTVNNPISSNFELEFSLYLFCLRVFLSGWPFVFWFFVQYANFNGFPSEMAFLEKQIPIGD